MDSFTLILLGLAAAWFAGSYLFATVGGWRKLSSHYSSAPQAAAEGEHLSYVSARFGHFVIYRSCLKAVLNSQGLSLSIFLLLRPWHPPIYLPWSDLRIEFRSKKSVEIRPAHAPGISISISDPRLVKALERYGVVQGGEQSNNRTDRKSRPVLVLLVWLLSGLLGGVLLGYHSLSILVTLMRNGAVVVGKVDSVTPADHHTLRYSFTIDAQSYSAIATDTGFGNAPYEQVTSGSSITITYNRNDPAVSIPGLAEPAFYSELRMVLLFAAIFGVLVAYVCHRRGWLKQKGKGPGSNRSSAK